MRRIAAALLLVPALAVPAFAGLPPVTLKGGLSMASVSGQTPVFEPRSKLGIMGAVDVGFPVAPGLTLNPELGFALRGFSYGESEFADQDGTSLGKFETLASTTVVTFSLPFRMALATSGPLGMDLLGGATFGFESRERFVTTGAAEGSLEADQLRGGDFGLIAGGALTLPVGVGRLGIEARYVYGLVRLARAGPLDGGTRALEVATSYTLNPRR